jgi:uncharacterized protein with ParB-like and HNH nuclease domain/predicted transport protein
MQAVSQSLTKLIDGRVQYIIPVFQRDYSWTEEQCAQLWNDVLNIASLPSPTQHFVGSIVYAPTHDTAARLPRWLLIDGQQRLTTVMLLVAALRDYLKEIGYNDPYLTSATLDSQFLRNVDLPPVNRPKLVLRRHDHETLHALLDGDEPPSKESERIRENYQYFRQVVPKVDPTTIYAGINRLEIVDVTLQTHDNPQSIFESLNSTGLDLSPSDLIRNFILMSRPEADQTRLYESIWYKIEVLFRRHEHIFDNFARDYVALKTEATKQGKSDEIYSMFRRSFASFCEASGGLEEALSEIHRHARYYAAFSLDRGNPDQSLRTPLKQLRRLVDVPAILVMRLFDCHERVGSLPIEEFSEALNLLESYVFRRAICGLQTRGYWSVFAAISHRIDEQNPLKSLKVCLARQSENYRFPHDQEFKSQLEQQDIYGKRVCRVLLERLENFNTKEPSNTSEYSIEHIMPQNERLPEAWREMLGPDWKTIQEHWLHRLGNLTLTAYNSEISDRSFETKKMIAGGFSDSAVRLNKFVREQAVWTDAEMHRRGVDLASRGLRIWTELQVSRALLDEAKRTELLRRAELGSVERVTMDDHARGLFRGLRDQVMGFEQGIVEVAEGQSISYHAGGFFVEVLPRTGRLLLLLAPGFNEIEDANGIAVDSTQWKFFVGSKYDGGVAVDVRDDKDVGQAIPLIKQALELVGRGSDL